MIGRGVSLPFWFSREEDRIIRLLRCLKSRIFSNLLAQQRLESLFPGKLEQLVIDFDLILYDVVLIVIGCSTQIAIHLLLNQLLTLLVDTGQALRINHPQKHLLTLHSTLPDPSTKVFLSLEDHFVLFSLEMCDPFLDLHRSPVILQQLLVIQGGVHRLDALSESIIFPLLLHHPTA